MWRLIQVHTEKKHQPGKAPEDVDTLQTIDTCTVNNFSNAPNTTYLDLSGC